MRRNSYSSKIANNNTNIPINKSNKNSGLSFFFHNLSLLLGIIYIVFTIQEFRGENAIIISTMFLIGWMITSFLANPNTYIRLLEKKKFLFLIIFLVYYFAGGLISGLNFIESTKLILGFLIILSPIIMYDYYNQNKKYKSLLILTFTTISMLIYLSVKTLFILHTVPNAARALASGSLHNEALGNLTTLGLGGGYNLAYALCLFIPFVAFLIKSNLVYSKKLYVISILSAALFIYTVIKSDFGMAFLFTAIGLTFTLVIFKGHVKKDMYFFLTILTVGGILFVLFLNPLAEALIYFSSFFQDSFIGQRLYELANGLQGSGYGSSTEYRFVLYENSVTTFIENPFIGVGFLTQYDYYKNLLFVGGHSEWLDFLGVFGLLGSIPFFLMLYISIQEVLKIEKYAKSQSALILVFLIFIILGTLNLVLKFGIFLILFLVIPNILTIIKFSKENNPKRVRSL